MMETKIQEAHMTNSTDGARLLEQVRDRYGEIARQFLADPSPTGCGCGHDDPITRDLYNSDETDVLPSAAGAASLGCGNPTALIDLHEGDVVLDLGSGGGIDVLLSARRVGSSGRAYGLDMTDEMLELARRNQSESGLENVEFLKGHMEDIPLPESSVDVIISNCVINLAPEKSDVFHEAHRVLRPGGRFAVTDIVTTRLFTAAEQADMASWTQCVAGAITSEAFAAGLEEAGFSDVEVEPTHQVGSDVVSAIIRATA